MKKAGENFIMPVPRYIKPRYEKEYSQCPICHKPYPYHEDMNQCYKCPTCLTRPERLFLLIPKEWSRDGQTHRLYCSPGGQPLDGLGAALELFYAIELDRNNSDDGKADLSRFKHKKIKELRFSEFSKTWLDTIKNDSTKKNSTKNIYECLLNTYILPYFKHKDIRNIGNYEIIKFKNQLKGKKGKALSDQQIKNILQVLRSILICAEDWENIKRPKTTMPKTEKKVVRVLTEGQFNLILSRFPKNDKYIFQYLLYTGARQSEACGLHFTSIDFEKKEAIIKDNYYRGELTTTKGKSQRKVPLDLFVDLTPMLKELYDNALDKKGYVFLVEDGTPYSGDVLQRKWRKAIKGITTLSLHKARATFASRLYELTKNPRYVQKKLGHVDFKTTQLYLEDYDNDEVILKLIKGKKAKRSDGKL